MSNDQQTSENIYYVCCATAQMQTNWQPLREYHPKVIKGILVLIGLSDLVNPTENDRTQALAPADHFERAVLNLGYPRPEKIQERAASFNGWPERVIDWIHRVNDTATTGSAFVIFNVTGGTKAMNCGAARGLQQAIDSHGNLRLRLVYAARGDVLHEQGCTQERRLPELGLEDFIALRGFDESLLERHNRVTYQAAVVQREGMLFDLWQAIQTGLQVEPFTALAAAIIESQKIETNGFVRIERHNLEVSLRRKSQQTTILLNILHQLCPICTPNPSLDGPWLRFTNADDLECSTNFGTWLQGHWLEELVFLRVRKLFAENNQDSDRVCLGVKTHRIDENGALLSVQSHELDVAFVVGGLLHVIECKSDASPSSKEKQIWMNRLIAIRTELTGLHGRVGLLHPRIVIHPNGAHGRTAKKQDLSCWQGNTALEELELAIQKYLQCTNHAGDP
ncbi:MAG: DUF1887 family CARF protein [Magnetococcus sp. YQC-9]